MGHQDRVVQERARGPSSERSMLGNQGRHCSLWQLRRDGKSLEHLGGQVSPHSYRALQPYLRHSFRRAKGGNREPGHEREDMERADRVSYAELLCSSTSRAKLIMHPSECQGILQGHTSLVGQLQMRGNTLVTGGSDGSVRVWSLEKNCAIHRLAAHDNSVTSLQFDDTRIVSGGSDGRVKVWDLKTGNPVRDLVTQSEAVWRVAFEDEKCVAMALKNSRTVMEVSSQKSRYEYFAKAESLTQSSGMVLLSSRGVA